MNGKREKFIFSLRKYIIDFMVKISFDRQSTTTDVEKGGGALLDFFVFGEFVLVFEINYLKSSFINKFHPLCRLSNLQKLPINSIIAAVQILA